MNEHDHRKYTGNNYIESMPIINDLNEKEMLENATIIKVYNENFLTENKKTKETFVNNYIKKCCFLVDKQAS
jgi:hypothetical protein